MAAQPVAGAGTLGREQPLTRQPVPTAKCHVPGHKTKIQGGEAPSPEGCCAKWGCGGGQEERGHLLLEGQVVRVRVSEEGGESRKNQPQGAAC